MGRGKLSVWAFVAALLAGCPGGGDDDEDRPPPPKITNTVFEALDPCAARVPQPTDLFRTEDGTEVLACDGPDDPIEKALFFAQIVEGVPTNSDIVIPVDGSLDGSSLTATASFALSGAATGGVPPLVMLASAPTASTAAEFEIIGLSASFDDAIRISPDRALQPGRRYVVVATNAIRDNEVPKKPIQAAPAVALLLGDATIAAGDLEGLDDTGADRLERTRQQLAPIVELLANASPPLTAEQIVAIQVFTTVPEPKARTEAIFESYLTAVQQGRYEFKVTTVGGDIDPSEIYPGLPPAAYASIQFFRRGTITVPQFLGDDGRQRDTFPQVKREIEIPFLMSIPRNVTASYPVVIHTSGYGRAKIDGRATANEFAETPQAAVLSLDLRCHGDRSPDAAGVCGEGRTQAEVAMLADNEANNDNPEIVAEDGIPDDSGQYYFSGDPQALRDGQLASAIELLHVYLTLRDRTAFLSEGLDPNQNDLHFIAQGHSALPALLAFRFAAITPRTIQTPSGGVGFSELILEGPPDLRASFVATMPEGVTEERLEEYVSRMEAGILRSVALETFADDITATLEAGGMLRKLLVNFGSVPSNVPESARNLLIDTLDVPNSRVSQHAPSCDDFYIFSCRLGVDDPTAPRQQIVGFMGSNGVTVIPP